MVNSYNILSAFALAGACPLDLRLPCGCLSPLICVCHCGCLSPSPAFAIAGACPLHLRLLLRVLVPFTCVCYCKCVWVATLFTEPEKTANQISIATWLARLEGIRAEQAWMHPVHPVLWPISLWSWHDRHQAGRQGELQVICRTRKTTLI